MQFERHQWLGGFLAKIQIEMLGRERAGTKLAEDSSVSNGFHCMCMVQCFFEDD